jgi:hypothetical protein
MTYVQRELKNDARRTVRVGPNSNVKHNPNPQRQVNRILVIEGETVRRVHLKQDDAFRERK